MTFDEAVAEAHKMKLDGFFIPNRSSFKKFVLFDGKYREVIRESESPKSDIKRFGYFDVL